MYYGIKISSIDNKHVAEAYDDSFNPGIAPDRFEVEILLFRELWH